MFESAQVMAPDLREMHLFMPFYTPTDVQRADELRTCLKHNLARPEFVGIHLFIDDDTDVEEADNRLSVIRLDRRPTYLDWVRYSYELCPGQVSILANSDIYFDDSIAKLRSILALDAKSFVALSRYDCTEGGPVPHPNPHWSQDVWAFRTDGTRNPVLEARVDVPLGVPRCDNKIAYLFSISGYTVYNPFRFITSMHLHQTRLRYYSKKGDRTLIGGMAMVRPSEALTEPAELELEIWSENSTQYKKLSVNKSLERWTREASPPRPSAISPEKPSVPVLGHDGDWQHPAVTEQHAFRMMHQLIASIESDPGAVYFGYPWATLIDLTLHARKRPDRVRALREILSRARAQVAPYQRVVTVCQHIHMLKFADLFADLGVTDIFWSHCIRGQNRFPGAPQIALHPFPLYPVQKLDAADLRPAAERDHLFSFVGAKATDIYLTDVRGIILDTLSDDPRGKIINRDTWHYNRIVYDRQILDRAKQGETLIDEAASAEFKQIMAQSTFTLCPSGTGPNSIRLWESFANGSIPVVLADSYLPPGNLRLWDLATVSCAETAAGVAALPDRLDRLASDPAQLAIKEEAGRMLSDKYGRDCFVYDVLALMQKA